MKKRMSAVLALALLLGCMPGAMAQEYVSVAALHDQAQAMGGAWRETFDTPNGEVAVDAPIVVPDVEAMPILTMEGAKISEELYNWILLGEKSGEKKDDIIYDEVELGGKHSEFFLGRENDYVNGKKTNICGYDAATILWIQHGSYRFSQGTGKVASAEPTTYHFPWQLDLNLPSMRNSELTVNQAMRLWQEDIDMCFPEDNFEIQIKTIEVHGSTLTDKAGKGKTYKNTGHYTISAEQVVDGVPLFGAIMNDVGASNYSVMFGSDQETNRTIDKLNTTYGVGSSSVLEYSGMQSRFVDKENYRTINSLGRVRTVEYPDVPLAPLESVLENIGEEIRAGNIREVYSVRLGYVLYANPDMKDYAWAIPRWVVSTLYVTKENQKHWEREQKDNEKWGYENPVWGEFYSEEILADAQNGKLLIFTVGDDATYSVPEIVTWEAIQ
ncbi:MAG: hypothetical protein ACI4MP_10150 [Candidatus Ventricola sp.]